MSSSDDRNSDYPFESPIFQEAVRKYIVAAKERLERLERNQKLLKEAVKEAAAKRKKESQQEDTTQEDTTSEK